MIAESLAPRTHVPRTSHRIVLLALWGLGTLALLPMASAWSRTWTDTTGKHQVEADYAGFADGNVKLRKSDGRVVEVPLVRLSEADRAYVQQRLAEDDPNSSGGKDSASDLQKQLSLSFEKPFAVFPPSDTEPLFATIELTGKAAAEATHYGFLEIADARAGAQERLEQVQSSFSMKDPAEQFVEVDRQRMFARQFEKPKNKLRVHVMLQRPPSAAKRLQVFEGSIDLLTSDQTQPVIVENIAQQTGKELAHPLLKKAGLRIQVVDPDEAKVTIPDAKPAQMVSLVIHGPESAILEMGLVDGQGDAMETAAAWSDGSGGPLSYTLHAEHALPRDTGFRLLLVLDQDRVGIPFRFENVPLPTGEDTTTADAVPGADGASGKPK